jgi:hypothetical protein
MVAPAAKLPTPLFPLHCTPSFLPHLTKPFSPPRTSGSRQPSSPSGSTYGGDAAGRSCGRRGSRRRALPWTSPSRRRPAQSPAVDLRRRQVNVCRPRPCLASWRRRPRADRSRACAAWPLATTAHALGPAWALLSLSFFIYPPSTWLITWASPLFKSRAAQELPAHLSHFKL